MIKMQAKLIVGEATIKGMINSITAFLPGTEIQVGNKWDTQLTMSSGGINISYSTNYKLKKINGNQAELSAESTIEPGSKDPIDMNGTKMTYDVRGLGKSTILVDTQTGWLIKTSTKQHLTGNIIISMQGNEMQIPVEMDGSTVIVSIP